jgi:hypothetical protein
VATPRTNDVPSTAAAVKCTILSTVYTARVLPQNVSSGIVVGPYFGTPPRRRTEGCVAPPLSSLGSRVALGEIRGDGCGGRSVPVDSHVIDSYASTSRGSLGIPMCRPARVGGYIPSDVTNLYYRRKEKTKDIHSTTERTVCATKHTQKFEVLAPTVYTMSEAEFEYRCQKESDFQCVESCIGLNACNDCQCAVVTVDAGGPWGDAMDVSTVRYDTIP